jgi:hypothetical protein
MKSLPSPLGWVSVASHRAVLRDAAREPGSAHHLASLNEQLYMAEVLLDEARALVGLAAAATGDRAATLVSEDLRRMASAITGAAAFTSGPDDTALKSQAELAAALAALDESFAGVRRRLGTVEHSTEELARLLSVMRCVHGVAAIINRASIAPAASGT